MVCVLTAALLFKEKYSIFPCNYDLAFECIKDRVFKNRLIK